jgi:hypothetical protein
MPDDLIMNLRGRSFKAISKELDLASEFVQSSEMVELMNSLRLAGASAKFL